MGHKLFSCSIWDLVPWPGIEPRPLHFLGCKITADGDCSHEIKRHLLLGRKVMANLDGILKIRHITWPTKVRLVVYECENWTIKNTERQRIESFWNVLLAKTLESPLDCKKIQPVNPKGNQSWIFIGRIDAEAETPTLATWCEELSYLKRPWCWERLKAGGERGDRRGNGQIASLTQ